MILRWSSAANFTAAADACDARPGLRRLVTDTADALGRFGLVTATAGPQCG